MALPSKINPPWTLGQARAAVNGLIDHLAQGGTMETYTGPTALALGSAAPGTVRQFYVAAAGTIDGVAVAKDSFHTFGRTSTGWHHYEPATGVPTPATNDTTRPSDVPTLTATVNGTSVLLQWGAATDNVIIESYDLTNDGGTTIVNVAMSTIGQHLREYTWTGLPPTTSVTFGVKARDASGNVSTNWKTATVTTGATSDSAPPSAPGALVTTPDMTAIAVTWGAATDDVGVTKYRISSNGGTTWTELGNVLAHTITGLTASTSYNIAVQAGDASGKWGPSATKTVSTTSSPAPGGDDFTGTGIDLSVHTHTTIGTPKPWEAAGSLTNNNAVNWKIVDNALTDNFAGLGTMRVFDWGGTDGVLTTSFKINDATGRLGVVFRYIDASNYAYLYIDGTYRIVQQVIAGTKSAAGTGQSVTHALGTFYDAEVTIDGNAVTVEINGAAALTATLDAALATGTRYGVLIAPEGGSSGAGKRAWDYLRMDPLP